MKQKEEVNISEQTENERQRLDKIIQLLGEEYPNLKSALNFENPFQLLVATILAAQCTDVRVNKVTEKLFKKYNGPADLANVTAEELEEDIKTCGLFRTKSKNIIASSNAIIEDYGGQVPKDFEELIKLPGVGRKTANVVLSNAFGVPAFAVDTHVFRVARRLGFSSQKDVFGVEKDLTEKIPRSLWIDAHRWLITHGRKVCHARNPKCEVCLLRGLCPEPKINRPSAG